MVTSQYEWKILEWDENPQTNTKIQSGLGGDISSIIWKKFEFLLPENALC